MLWDLALAPLENRLKMLKPTMTKVILARVGFWDLEIRFLKSL